MFALVDCNNFYASCERVFQPKLKGVPVAVLSNNDGCVIARSNEVKALGIPMGAPAFKCKALFRKHGVRLFSPNFELYGDMSDRVMRTLRPFTERMEIYSIDEAFALLPTLPPPEYEPWGQAIRHAILKATGIPVSVGIAPTKTLSKIALALIKQTPERTGVLDLSRLPALDRQLASLSVREVWGIGHAFTERLDTVGIRTVKDLKYADERRIKKALHVNGLRTVLELNGRPCLPLTALDAPCKSVICSRSFSRELTTWAELREAVAAFAARAAAKLRQEQRTATILQVFVETNRFKEKDWYANVKAVVLPRSTNYTPDLLAAAQAALRHLFLPDRNYKRAGVLLSELQNDSSSQPDLFGEVDAEALGRRTRLMETLDTINKRFGRDTARFLAEGIRQPWRMKRLLKSPAYTTRLGEIPVARC
jgi:DNA polymerase V